MELDQFIKKFIEQFEETDVSLIDKDTKFKDIDEWSSLFALTIIALADEEYEVRIKGDEIAKTNTVEELFELIKSKK